MFKILNFLFKKKKSKHTNNTETISTIKNESISNNNIDITEKLNHVENPDTTQNNNNEDITIIENKEENVKIQVSNENKNTLTENEIIFLKEMEGKKVNAKLSKKTEEIVSNAYELRKSLCQEGYLRVQSTYEKLENLKVVELKEILKQNSLKVSGKKSELISRILECLPEKEVEKLSKGRQYILTEKGIKTINSLTI